MKRRIEAAAKAYADMTPVGVGYVSPPTNDERAARALIAADAVMFDDAAVERAIEALVVSICKVPHVLFNARAKESYRQHVRAVIAALRDVP